MTPQRLVALIGLALVTILGSERTPAAMSGDALPYSRSYLLTGGYVASGVDLTDQNNPIDANGFSTGTIHINGVPADADIEAAYMYFESITYTASLSDVAGVTFRGETLLLNDLMAVKKSRQDLAGSTASCWSSGTPLSLSMFRADVLRWLPIRLDKDGKPTGKRLVNDADLIAHGLPLHQVKLPARSGNAVPESAGASLVIVYRDPSQPLKKIVLYDGLHIQSSVSEVTTQSLQGFYRSSAQPSAQLTYIIGSGQPNSHERIFFNDGVNTPIATADPIAGGNSSQRAWSTLTYDVTGLMHPGNNAAAGYGETATTTIDHTSGGYDCLAIGAVIFSTAVADVDHDGLPDGLEDAAPALKDPNGSILPDLAGMGASSSHPDIFLEFNGMWAPAGTTYGGVGAPYNATTPSVSDPAGHNHTPTPEMLKLIGDAYVAHGITPHFDVGDIATYHADNLANNPQKLGVVTHVDWVDDYTSTVADSYLVPSTYARGGEVVKEVACDGTNPGCQFSKFPGTVGWKLGLQLYRDQPVGANGEELSDYSNWAGRRRFDQNRFGLFHYVLYAHARGTSKSSDPNNPDFHVPLSRSGVADLPGGNVLVTLGLWDDFVGRPFVRAATTFHEIGHNLDLWHGGLPAVWGNAHPLGGALPTSTYIEPNCKPNYLSSMSYLFQVNGLFDSVDDIHLDYSDRDYSGSPFSSINETAFLNDGSLPEPPVARYLPAWFAPAGSALAASQGAPASTRFCDGSRFGAVPPSPMARVHATDISSHVDWDGDPATSATPAAANVNFDGTPDGVPTFSSQLRGFNDWAHLRLDQIGAGRNTVRFQHAELASPGSGDFIDVGSGDFTDYGSGDFIDVGSGDFIDVGSGDFIDVGSGDFIDVGSGDFIDVGSGDFIDVGSGDFLDYGTGSERQELDFDSARRLAPSAPFHLTACIVGLDVGCAAALPFTPQYHRVQVAFNSSTVGHVFQYVAERKLGTASSLSPYLPAGTSATPTTKKIIDPTELANHQPYTYRVRTEFDDQTPHTFSPWSVPVTITAVNDPPTANGNTFSTPQNTLLATGNLLTNDVDDDSSALTALLAVQAAHGFAVVNANGTLTYMPNAGFVGDDTFTYYALDVTPLSVDNVAATVTIHVTAVDTTSPVVTVGTPPNNAVYVLKSVVLASYSCSDAAPGSGIASCIGTVANGAPINTSTVGPKTFTVTATDNAGNTTTVTNNYSVVYNAVLSPLKSPANLGSAVPINWQLKDADGTNILSLSTLLKMESVFNGVAPAHGSCVASATGVKQTLFMQPIGATGGSNLRLVSGGYQFNWDTSTAAPSGKGCYTVLLYLNDLSTPKMTSAVQLR